MQILSIELKVELRNQNHTQDHADGGTGAWTNGRMANEPPHDKINKVAMCSTKISLGIRKLHTIEHKMTCRK